MGTAAPDREGWRRDEGMLKQGSVINSHKVHFPIPDHRTNETFSNFGSTLYSKSRFGLPILRRECMSWAESGVYAATSTSKASRKDWKHPLELNFRSKYNWKMSSSVFGKFSVQLTLSGSENRKSNINRFMNKKFP